jgi:hypothetical protein
MSQVLPFSLIQFFMNTYFYLKYSGEQSGFYFDAHVHDRIVKAHGPEECHCTFLVRFDHDQAEVLLFI